VCGAVGATFAAMNRNRRHEGPTSAGFSYPTRMLYTTPYHDLLHDPENSPMTHCPASIRGMGIIPGKRANSRKLRRHRRSNVRPLTAAGTRLQANPGPGRRPGWPPGGCRVRARARPRAGRGQAAAAGARIPRQRTGKLIGPAEQPALRQPLLLIDERAPIRFIACDGVRPGRPTPCPSTHPRARA